MCTVTLTATGQCGNLVTMETFTGMLLFIISNKNMASNLQKLSEAKLQYLREKYENHPQIVSGVREIGSLPSCWVWNHAHKRKDDDWKRNRFEL